jgi:flagellar FliJ protein
MGFRYALQKIVDLKQSEKSQAEWILADAIQALRREEAALQELREEKRRIQEEMQNKAKREAPIADLQALHQYVAHLDRAIASRERDVKAATRRVDECREGLGVKMREEKLWQKARERAYIGYMEEMRKKEQQELDELAGVRFGM